MKLNFNIKISHGISMILLLLLMGCQKDDICPKAVPTTPQLIIRFYDIEHPDELKPAVELNLVAKGQTDSLFAFPQTTDSIAIPLKTSQDITKYQFIIYTGEDDENNAYPSNSDTLQFSYFPNELFVSKACGYKTQFLDLQVEITPENADDNWIKDIDIQEPNIENERRAHLYIYH